MRTVLIIMVAVLLLAIVGFGWFNRGSDKVLSAILSGLGISTLAAITSIFYSEDFDSKTAVPAAIYLRAADLELQQPINGWRNGELFALPEYRKVKTIPSDQIERRRLVHQALQAALILTLHEMSGPNWKFSSVETSVPWLAGNNRVHLNQSGDLMEKPEGDIIKMADVARAAPGNPFLQENTFNNFGEMRVPPGMKLTVSQPVPVFEGAPLDQGVIELKCPLATLTITTLDSGGGHEPPEFMRPYLAEYPYDPAHYDYQAFIIIVRTSYTKWRVGDPDMRDLRTWMSTLTDSIVSDYDEARLWKDFKENTAAFAKAKELRRVEQEELDRKKGWRQK